MAHFGALSVPAGRFLDGEHIAPGSARGMARFVNSPLRPTGGSDYSSNLMTKQTIDR
jgi:hypothetical protein